MLLFCDTFTMRGMWTQQTQNKANGSCDTAISAEQQYWDIWKHLGI